MVPSTASAQETGIRAGSFILRPLIELGGSYSDNVFFDSTDEKEDYVAVLGGQLEIESDWSRHALALSGSFDFARFLENTDENNEEYGLAAAGRLDLMRGTAVSLAGSYDRRAERRDNAENETNITDVDEYSAIATLNHRPNRLGLRLSADFKRRDFQATQDEDRDRNDYNGAFRVSYTTTPQFSVFGEPFLTVRDFDKARQNGTSQDSFIYGSLFGAELDFRGTLTGELGVGAFREEFDEDERNSFSGLALDGALTWRPTELTRVTGEVSRRPQATRTAGASSKVRTQTTVTIRHEVKRDLTLSVLGDYFREDFEGIERVDDTYRGSVGMAYQIRDRLSLFSDYEYRQRDSDTASRSFRSHTVTFGLRGRF